MSNFNWKKNILPHLIVIAVFLLVALIYCSPALEGKVLQQHDVMGWKGMAQNSFNYKETHGHFPLWSNGMFSGMPAYQIAVEGNNPLPLHYIGNALSLFLPKPANYFFLASICFYILCLAFRTRPFVGMLGGLAYAYATYNPIIISVGHDTKMHALALLPAFLASVKLLFDKKYITGGALTGLFTALLIGANHLQITYYGLIILGFMTIGYLIRWIKQKEFKHIIITFSIAIVAGLTGVLYNAVTLFTTYEYAKESIRGGSALADEKSNFTKTGLSTDYALSYSMGIAEPMVMMFPKMFGGSSSQMEVDAEKSKAVEALQNMPQEVAQQLQQFINFYWGGIDGVGTSGPPYTGAVVCFLALVGLAVLDGRHKWWILGTIVFTLLLSWGKYFEGFNIFMLEHLPFYNKFRAPSMILVVPTLLLCLLAVLSVEKIVSIKYDADFFKKYKQGLMISGGLVVLALLVYFSSSFSSDGDARLLSQIQSIPDPQQKAALEQPVKNFVAGLRDDRQGLMMSTILRSLFFMAAAAAVIWAIVKNKLNAVYGIIAITMLAFIDVITVDTKYLNKENYLDAEDVDAYFHPSAADNEILKDTGFYRVFDLTQGVGNAFNGNSLSSYFHHNIGGYHPAKLSIYQDLIENQLYNFPNAMPTINMLNTKYIINADPSGKKMAYPNPEALGNAWFVKGVKWVETPRAAMDALTHFSPSDTAVIDKTFKSAVGNFSFDSAASIRLIKNDNDLVTYQYEAPAPQLAVFSEIYYKHGWKAYIDNKEADYVKANYVLRAMVVPAGKHDIRFEFKPASFYTGNTISLVATALIWLALLAAAIVWYRQNNRREKNTA